MYKSMINMGIFWSQRIAKLDKIHIQYIGTTNLKYIKLLHFSQYIHMYLQTD